MITLSHAASISKAKIETLHKDFKRKVMSWYEACCQEGLLPYVYEGFRSLQRQKELYAIGRSLPGKIVTNADVGQSFHNYGMAIDWVPLQRVAKAEGMYEDVWGKPKEEELYRKGQAIANKYGLRHLTWERPHLEDASFSDWRDLRNKVVL